MIFFKKADVYLPCRMQGLRIASYVASRGASAKRYVADEVCVLLACLLTEELVYSVPRPSPYSAQRSCSGNLPEVVQKQTRALEQPRRPYQGMRNKMLIASRTPVYKICYPTSDGRGVGPSAHPPSPPGAPILHTLTWPDC